MIQDNLRNLYNTLRNEGYNPPDYDAFKKDMEDEDNLKRVYSTIQKAGYTPPEYDTFKSDMGFGGQPSSAKSESDDSPLMTSAGALRPSDVVVPGSEEKKDDDVWNGGLDRDNGMWNNGPVAATDDYHRYRQSLEDTWDVDKGGEDSGWQTPMLETDVTLDENLNKSVKPALVPGTDEEGKMTGDAVYKDVLTGRQYKTDDPEVQKAVDTQTYIMPYDVEQATREQLESLSTDIDKALAEAEKRDAQNGNSATQTLTDENASFFERFGAAQALGNTGDVLATPETVTANQLATAASPEVQQLTAAQRKIRDAQRIIQEADINAQKGTFGKWLKGSFAGGAARGFGQKIGDMDTWDFGASEGSDAINVFAALQDFDAGKKLTDAQQKLLDAVVIENAVNKYFGEYVGNGYTAGSVTAEAIPFMIEMAVNPAAGAGKGAESAMTRYFLKRFGKEAIKKGGGKYLQRKAMEIGSRFVGDVAGSAVMSSTTGIDRVAAGTIERMSGDVEYGLDDQGNYVFTGHTEGDDAGTAFLKSLGSQTIENYSEMVGDYFSPLLKAGGKATAKGLEKIGLGSVNRFVERVGASDLAKMTKDFAAKTQWHGTIGEYAEENVGSIMNALTVGDETLVGSDGKVFGSEDPNAIFNWDKQVDTFLGVALMGGFMSGIKTMGYRTPKYEAKKGMNRADDAGLAAFGNNEDVWNGIRNSIAFGTEDELKGAVRDIVSSDQYDRQQRRAVLDYAKSVMEYRGVIQAEDKRREDEETDPALVDAETSYDNGYTLETLQEMNDARNILEYRRRQLGDIVTDEQMARFDADPLGELRAIRNMDAYSAEDEKKALAYVNAKATYDGMVDRVVDETENKVSASDREVDSRTHVGDGMVHPARLKEDDREVYVMNGNVSINEDGTIDTGKSDGSLVVRDASTGKLEYVDVRDLVSADAPMSASEMKEQAGDAIREEMGQTAANKIDGVLAFAQGDSYTVSGEDGQAHEVQVVQDNGDGTVSVTVDGVQEPTVMSKDQLQEMSEQYNMQRLEEYESRRVAQEAEAEQAQAEAEAATAEPSPAENAEGTEAATEGTAAEGAETAVAPVGEAEGVDAASVEQGVSETTASPTAEVAEAPATAETGAEMNVDGRKVFGPMPMIGEGEDAEPDFSKTDPVRGHHYIYNEADWSKEEADAFVDANVSEAQKALAKVEKKVPKVGTSIPKYKKAKAAWEAEVAGARRRMDYWNSVKSVADQIASAEAAERLEEQRRRDEATHAQAVADQAAFEDSERAKAAEQAERGANAVHPAIREKWERAEKIVGNANELTLANGERVKGRYVLVESGAATPSHNAVADFARSEGFPVDENGETVNDRDYERDRSAQDITRNMAANYDGRAAQNVPVVSSDGVVLSGNGRTMAGELAARDNTDGAYTEHLMNYGGMYGFTPEQVSSMSHPRVVFVPDGAMPYTTETFAKFNAQEMKSQSKTEQAVKLGKIVDDGTFRRIVRMINGYDTLGDFYADVDATRRAINELRDAGALNDMEYAEMFDGDTISAQGREILENMLIGKAFESNPDAVRMLTSLKSLRQSVVQALADISDNIALGEGYSVENELADAIALAYRARKEGYKAGAPVSAFARQLNLFQFEEGESVVDYKNAVVLMLADVLNDSRQSRLKKWMQVYNNAARESAAGQMDMFSGGVRTKEDIFNDVKQLFDYGSETEQQDALQRAVESRKESSREGESAADEAGSGVGSNESDEIKGGGGDSGLSGAASDFADTVGHNLADRMKGRRKKDDEEVAEEKAKIERTMMGVHNITEGKLKSALKLGGLANPSMAVIDTRNGMLTNFGGISLIPSNRLLDRREGRNAGTFAADGYTPRFPQTYRRLGKDGKKNLEKWLDGLGLNPEMRREVKNQFDDWYTGFNIPDEALAYTFLKEKGLSDEVDYYNRPVDYKFADMVKRFKGDAAAMMDAYANDPELRKELSQKIMEDIYADNRTDPRKDGESVSDYMKRIREWKGFLKNIYLKKDGNVTDELAESYIRRECDNWLKGGAFDGRQTQQDAVMYMRKNGLEKEYQKYFDEKMNDLGAETQVFDGYNRDGQRKFKKASLEEVSKQMNKEGLAGAEGGIFGDSPGALRARMAPMLETLDQMRDEKGRLVSHEDFGEIGERFSDRVFDIKNSMFEGSFDDMQGVLMAKDMKAAAKRRGYDLSKEELQELKSFKDEILSMPTEYFETKFERPVMLNEFVAAVVPEGTSEDVVEALKDAGLDVREYNPEVETSREKVMRDVVEGRDDVLFREKEQTKSQAKAKQKQKITNRAKELGEKLGVKVRLVENRSELPENWTDQQKKRRKGWYDKKTGEVVIIVPNQNNVADVEATVLHEVVAHKGLRELFGKDFDAFLDNVFDNVDKDVRQRIVDLAMRKYGGDFRTATEEYLAGLAEDMDFESEQNRGLWAKVKAAFMELLRKAGIKLSKPLTDADLQYVLWRSYNRLENRGAMGVAEDVEMREKLGIEESSVESRESREEGQMFRDDEDESVETGFDEEEEVNMPEESEADAEANLAEADAGPMSFGETMTQGLVDLSNQHSENAQLKADAMRSLNQQLSRIINGAMQFGEYDADESRERQSQGRGMLKEAARAQRGYDKGIVDAIVRLARTLMRGGFLSGFTAGETSRLLGMVRRAVGRRNIDKQAREVVGMMQNHMMRTMDGILKKMLNIKGRKTSQAGNEVIGRLDPAGQVMIEALNTGITLSDEALATGIEDVLDKMGSENEETKERASAKYQGLMLAKQYKDEIRGSEREEAGLKKELADAKEELKDGTMTREAYREFVRETEDAILKNKQERIDAYARLIDNISGNTRASSQRAREFRERAVERVREVQHNANSDLQGKTASEHRKPSVTDKIKNWSIIRFFMRPLATFDQMLRYFGRLNVDGKGYLWNRFMGGWTEANDAEWNGIKDAHNELDAKVSEVFGKKMRWSDLFNRERKMKGIEVEFWDAGEMVSHELTQGNMLYIYMVNKMQDGRMKLRKMGITDEMVEQITDAIDPRFLKLADWLQDEFLPKRREKYNAVHERLFGVPMASIDNYFPLKINKASRGQDVDVGVTQNDDEKPAEITGAIIKRVKNSTALDVTGADAFDVVLGHIQEMEHWAAFAEFNHNLNTLLSYKRFRNKVKNMGSVRFGAGDMLWNNFMDVCRMVAGVYRPRVKKETLDNFINNIVKGVTMAKISGRLWTAAKQLSSIPFVMAEASIDNIVKYVNPVGAALAWNWAVKELPGFAKRWESKKAGDTRLTDSDLDWRWFHKGLTAWLGRVGMAPNAFVDAMTVAMGSKAIYETKLSRYKKIGYSSEQAKKLALRDASVAYNSSQQSSEAPFVSAMQVDRTTASSIFTLFRNASMGYERKLTNALKNLQRKLTPGYHKQSVEFMTKQMIRDGIDEEKAARAARRMYYKSYYDDLVNVAVFGFVMQLCWNLMPYIPYLLMGDDDDEKKEMKEDAFMHAFAGPVEGLTGGNVISELYNLWRSGEGISNYQFHLLPLVSDIQNMSKKFKNKEVEAWQDLANLFAQGALGINPQTLTDAYVAVMDNFNGDPETAKDFSIMWLRIMQCPQKQTDKLYIDELGMNARDAQKEDINKLCRRWAEYKAKKGAPVTGFMYDDSELEEIVGKYEKRFMTMVSERQKKGGDPDVNAIVDEYKEDEYKRTKQTMDHINSLKNKGDFEDYAQKMGEFAGTPEYRHYRIYNSINDKINQLMKLGMYDQADELKAQMANMLGQ